MVSRTFCCTGRDFLPFEGHHFQPLCSQKKANTTASLVNLRASLAAQILKHLPTMQETQVPSLTQEDPLEKGMATHSSIPAWRIPWTEEPGRLQFMGSQRVGHHWPTNTHTRGESIHPCHI